MVGGGVSPSVGIPEVTCRREILLRRHYPYKLNPFRLWAAMEGTFYHKGLLEMSGRMEGWEIEVGFPREEDEGKPSIRRHPVWGFLQVEVWPGVWMSARVDAWHRPTGTILNLKSTRVTKVDYGYKKDWTIQSNLERMIMNKCGESVKLMEIWRVYKGCYEEDKAWRKFMVPFKSDGEMTDTCAAYLRELILWDTKMTEGDKDDVLSQIPLEGEVKKMFNGKKCTLYCSCYQECMARAGRVRF